MDELNEIIKTMCQSKHLIDWIIALKDNEVLFSPAKNIRPCIEAENGVRSDYWNGLSILETYCERGIDNEIIDSFIINLLKKSINIYKTDKSEDPYSKLNSSYYTIESLIRITLSKPLYINNVDIVFLVKTFFEGVISWPYSIVSILNKSKNVLLRADKKKVFNIFKTALINSKRISDYLKEFIITDLISADSMNYYSYSSKVIENELCKKSYYTMGSFLEYDEDFLDSTDIACFEWLKISSQGIETKVLKNDVKRFIKSDNRLLNKAGLCLININFARVSDLFYENIKLFFNKSTFYPDLVLTLKNNGKSIFADQNQETMIEAITTASFGKENDDRLKMLKNHVLTIYKKYGVDVDCFGEDKNTLDFVTNYDKFVYSVSSDREGNQNLLKEDLKDKDIEYAVRKYKQLSEGSFIFKSTINDVYVDYFLNKYPTSYHKYLELFDPDLMITFINSLSAKESKNIDQLIILCKCAINVIHNNNKFKSVLSSLLFVISKIWSKDTYSLLKPIVLNIDYNWFELNDYESDDISAIDVCINEKLYYYLDLISIISLNENDLNILSTRIDGLRAKSNNSKFKSILASVFSKITRVNSDYALSMIDYVFNNTFMTKNMSYPLLALHRPFNDWILDLIGGRNDFVAFLKCELKGSDKTAQSVIFSHLFRCYIFDNKYQDLINLVFSSKKYDIMIDYMSNLNYWAENDNLNSANHENIKSFLLQLSASLETKNERYITERLVLETSKLLQHSKLFDDILWSTLIKLCANGVRWIPDETFNLLSKQKIDNYPYVSKILGSIFYNYEIYSISDDSIVSLFKLVSGSKEYKDLIVKWRVAISKKNHQLVKKMECL